MKKALSILLLVILTCCQANAQTGCVASQLGKWVNTPLSSVQSGSFEVTFDATPATSTSDTIISLAQATATTYANSAVTVRFNPSGKIDARKGGSYTATNSISYSAGQLFHFRIDVTVPSHVFTAFVTPDGGTEILIGSAFAFRTEQASSTSLGFWNIEADAGGASVCNFQITGTPPPPPPPPPTLNITTTSLPGGTVGVSYTATVIATGGITPYVWSISTGALPDGLSLSASTGVISGTPTTAGTSFFAVQVKDTESNPQVSTLGTSIVVSSVTPPPPPPPTVSSAMLTVNGANFLSGAVITLNGTNLPTTFVSSTQLTATVPLNSVTVTNPVVPPPPPPPPPVTISIVPATATVQNSQTIQFNATVMNSTDIGVTWSATGAGTVNSTGLFSASATAIGPATVTATSHADPTKSATATITVTAPPPPPVHSATLSWTASTSTPIDGYNVYRATVSGGPYTILNTSPVTPLTFTDLTVLAGQTYFYVVTAVSAGIESAFSTEVSGTIPTP